MLEDWMKGNPVQAGGPTISKPTSWHPQTYAATSAIFVFCVAEVSLTKNE